MGRPGHARVDPVTGKPIRPTVYGDTQAEARRRLEVVIDSHQNKRPGSDMTLKAAVTFWKGSQKSLVDPRNLRQCDYDLAEVLRDLGRVPINALSAFEVQRWAASADMSVCKVYKSLKRLRQVLRHCVGLGLIAQNVAAMVPLPRYSPKEIRPLTVAQTAALLREARGRTHEAIYWLALDSGARQGELLALTAGDIDMGAAEVVINKSVHYHDGEVVIRRPKTKAGRRRVPITTDALDVLRPLLAVKSPEDYLFAATDGRPLHRQYFSKCHWAPVRKAAGLSGVRFHDLRHTCATVQLLENVHVKVVSERLGHAIIQVTLDTYSHLLPTMQDRAVAAMARYFAAVRSQ